MEIFLLKAVALLRPVASAGSIFGDTIPDIVAAGLVVAMLAALGASSAVRKSVAISAIDITIFAIVIWCLSIGLIYFEVTNFRELAKLLIPLLTYVVTKNILIEPKDYKSLLLWMIVGFSVAVLLSVVWILVGQGVERVSYWSGIPRWQGVYSGSHNFGHSMTFFLFVIVIYVSVDRVTTTEARHTFSAAKKVLLFVLSAMAVYCLYMSQVRTALVGLVVFLTVILYSLNKRLLLIGAIGVGGLAVVTFPIWKPVLLPDVVLLEEGKADALDMGSGRPRFWLHNLGLFTELPIDRKLAGVGIGNTAKGTSFEGTEEVIDSHNDWLNLLLQTGIVGFMLWVLLQGLVLKAILNLQSHERQVFLALFVAVNLMMILSNSYIFRIAVGQTYYMVLAYIEARQKFRVITE